MFVEVWNDGSMRPIKWPYNVLPESWIKWNSRGVYVLWYNTRSCGSVVDKRHKAL